MTSTFALMGHPPTAGGPFGRPPGGHRTTRTAESYHEAAPMSVDQMES
ncbi:hypothetical protein ATKI12_3212 [Kitasatospora sp. Ki12]